MNQIPNPETSNNQNGTVVDFAATRRELRFHTRRLIRDLHHPDREPRPGAREELWKVVRYIEALCPDAKSRERAIASFAAAATKQAIKLGFLTVRKKPEAGPDPQPVVIRRDHREEIRESRAFESTTGPPR
jgi:hypothetical protein